MVLIRRLEKRGEDLRFRRCLRVGGLREGIEQVMENEKT